MTTLHRCDQCGYSQEAELPFAVAQQTQEVDGDGEPIEVGYDLCSAQCLADLAMGLSLDFPEKED